MADKKQKFYAIAAGQRVGVYDNWTEAAAQVQGFPGAKYKAFATRAEAESWLADPSFAPAPARNKKKRENHDVDPDTLPKPGHITIYSDGGARNNPGPGGYGVVMLYDEHEKELSGGYRRTTNNRMELMGCIVALRQLKRRDVPITLHTDSSYVVNGITKGWAKSWRRNGWLKADRQPALNQDLWAELLDLIEGLMITFKWVKGHAGHPYNERCDELAVAASGQSGLPEDSGYAG